MTQEVRWMTCRNCKDTVAYNDDELCNDCQIKIGIFLKGSPFVCDSPNPPVIDYGTCASGERDL